MLIGFLDDARTVVNGGDTEADIFTFGGFFIRQDWLGDFQRRIAEVKQTYDLPGCAPVKWNMRNTGLQKFYRSENFLSPALADNLLDISGPLRRDLLWLLYHFDAKVLVCGRYDVAGSLAAHSDIYAWAFENLLLQAGQMARGIYEQRGEVAGATLVIDRPQGGVDKRLLKLYYDGYHLGAGLESGQKYHYGPLKWYDFAESFLYGSTLHSGPLQLANLVAGCCRDFLAWAITGTNIHKIQILFDILVPLFYLDPQGRLNNSGFKVARANNLDIEAKVDEYLNLMGSTRADELPFDY